MIGDSIMEKKITYVTGNWAKIESARQVLEPLGYQIDNIKIGQEVMLSVSSINQNYTGYITKISSTASNGTFTAIATFENDGNLKIGMTGKCTITVI